MCWTTTKVSHPAAFTLTLSIPKLVLVFILRSTTQRITHCSDKTSLLDRSDNSGFAHCCDYTTSLGGPPYLPKPVLLPIPKSIVHRSDKARFPGSVSYQRCPVNSDTCNPTVVLAYDSIDSCPIRSRYGFGLSMHTADDLGLVKL